MAYVFAPPQSGGCLYLSSANRIYRGEITHNGNAYPGEQRAIVEEALWDEVQAVLTENRVNRAAGSDAKHPSLLAGMAFDEDREGSGDQRRQAKAH